jgi:large subunit ribosomal protein L17
MRHGKKVAKLGRTASHRKALLRNLCNELFRHKRIVTTLAKAKAARIEAERLLTFAKQGDLAARRLLLSRLGKQQLQKAEDGEKVKFRSVIHELVDEIGPKLKGLDDERKAKNPNYTGGGYTRVLKLGNRRGDAAPMAVLEIVGYETQQIEKREKAKEEREVREKRKMTLAERIKAKKEEMAGK